MSEARVLRERIACLGRALQDPIDQQILWHLLSAERASPIWVHLVSARRANADATTQPGMLPGQPLGDIDVTPSRTAEITRRPRAELRVHYGVLHSEGLIVRTRRIPHRTWPEHAYALSPGLRPVLEAISVLVLPDTGEDPPPEERE